MKKVTDLKKKSSSALAYPGNRWGGGDRVRFLLLTRRGGVGKGEEEDIAVELPENPGFAGYFFAKSQEYSTWRTIRKRELRKIRLKNDGSRANQSPNSIRNSFQFCILCDSRIRRGTRCEIRRKRSR